MLTLFRYNYDDFYTQGVLLDEKGFLSDTLELPYKDNQQFVSAIPEGEYEIQYREDSHAHVKEAYLLKSVSDRNGILIHVANNVHELQGCIAVGTKYGAQLYDSLDSFLELKDRAGAVNKIKIVGLR